MIRYIIQDLVNMDYKCEKGWSQRVELAEKFPDENAAELEIKSNRWVGRIVTIKKIYIK